MAMAVKKLPVGVRIAPTEDGRKDVVDFEQVSVAELESTPGAAPALLVEQARRAP